MNRTELIKTKCMQRETTIQSLSDQTGIKLRTLKRYIHNPDMMPLGALRAIHSRLRFSDEELARFGKSV